LKILAALIVCLSLAAMPQARADLVLADRDFSNEALAAAATVGFLKIWEQADLIERMLDSGKSTETAKELLASMQTHLEALQQRVERLSRTAETGPVRRASW
jgi:hypothetical protein